LSFKNIFPSISVIDEISDFKFSMQLGFAKAHHQTSLGKSGHGVALGELPKLLRFHLNIYTMAEARNFKFGTHLRFTKAYHKITTEEKWAWPWAKEAPIYFGFPFIISAAAALSS